MTVGQLIARLQEFAPDTEVAILDSFNGGGEPRTINFGPIIAAPGYEPDYDHSDIESPPGTPIVVMGYGCY